MITQKHITIINMGQQTAIAMKKKNKNGNASDFRARIFWGRSQVGSIVKLIHSVQMAWQQTHISCMKLPGFNVSLNVYRGNVVNESNSPSIS